MRKSIILGLALALLSGCGGEPKLDATDDATIKASMEKMGAGLSEEQKKEFGQSVMVLTVLPAMQKAFKAGVRAKPGPQPTAVEMMKPLHGMTVAEINAKAKAVREEMKAKRGG